VKSHHPLTEGQEVTVRIADEGSGMIGLENPQDNKDWSGMLNHVQLNRRLALHISKAGLQRGLDTDPTRIANGFDVSHAGRRVGEEARYYPGAVKEADEKASITYGSMGAKIIEGKVPQSAFELVVALGHGTEEFSVDPAIYDSLDYKIAIYADHRTSQTIEPLHKRMGDFLLQNFFTKEQVTTEKKSEVYDAVREVIERQKGHMFGGGEEDGITLDEADMIACELGASEGSTRLPRKELMRLILQDAKTEAFLIKSGIDVENIDESSLAPTRWERYLRRLYINDAEEGIFSLYKELEAKLSRGEIAQVEFDREFNPSTWWGKSVREIVDRQSGVPYQSRSNKPQGVDRAIEFLEWLETTDLYGTAQNLPRQKMK
jgi:hypothetical protein